MKRCLIASALILAGTLSAVADDDQTTCNNPNAHQAENFAACDRAISSGRFSGPALRDLYFNRGRHRSAVRNADGAFVDFSQALQIDSNNADLIDRAFISAVAAGKVEEGIALARRLLGVNKNNQVARLVVGVQELKLKQYAAAQQDLKQSVRGPITDLVAALLTGWASYGAGDAKAAVIGIDRLTGPAWYPLFKDFHVGMMLELAGKEKDAGDRLERAYRLDDTMLRVGDEYGRWLTRNKDGATASVVYEALNKKLPQHPLLQEGLRAARAGAKLPPLLDSPQAGAAEALYGIGATLVHRGGEDLALVYLQLALYLVPDHPLALLSLAELYETVKNPALAIKVYDRIATSSSLWRHAQIQIATDLDASDRTDEGARKLRSLISDSPRDIEAIVALGNIERGHKRFTECTQTYSQAIDVLADGDQKAHWPLFYFRGICLERSNQWPKAEADLRKTLVLQPDEPNVLNYLGYSLVDRGFGSEEAISMIRRAVEQKPDDGYFVDSLGWAYFQIGNFQDAEKNLRRAVELKPDDPTIHLHLGDTFWKLGLKSQARAEWAEGLRHNPEPNDAADLQQRARDGLPDGSGPAVVSGPFPSPAQHVATAQPEKPASPAPPKAMVPAGRRVALVIGNSEYRSVPALTNPSRDSRTVADALRKVGFQSVSLLTDATRDKMVEALRNFASVADKADWAVIYYAGHGIEVGGQNYLIPVDAKLASDRDVQFETISLEQVMNSAEGAGKLRLVLLDACRDNPFANMMKRSTVSRSVGRGLGQVEPDAGMLVVYAAKHGQVAFDGDGQNSPFVSAFTKRIATPQIEIRKLFDLVRDDVMSATKRQQQPFTYGSVPGSEDFYFLTADTAARN